ncbi:hypothetical protein PSPO01_03945 [Paraphaeosphaeria sporulosa]
MQLPGKLRLLTRHPPSPLNYLATFTSVSSPLSWLFRADSDVCQALSFAVKQSQSLRTMVPLLAPSLMIARAGASSCFKSIIAIVLYYLSRQKRGALRPTRATRAPIGRWPIHFLK